MNTNNNYDFIETTPTSPMPTSITSTLGTETNGKDQVNI